ncbi:hypothetical protein RRG08_065730 [Elysia crispata]|uniref:Uncharacterized protein n=1 Tax=Elysia crispata TaxID=231223 RepID=A0AAE0Z820_9GAST|nr:hypothetical protein RRG08_065730 [Elysia crispata]
MAKHSSRRLNNSLIVADPLASCCFMTFALFIAHTTEGSQSRLSLGPFLTCQPSSLVSLLIKAFRREPSGRADGTLDRYVV